MDNDHGKKRKRSVDPSEDVKSIKLHMQPQDPQDSSLFFRKLPPEIRLEIYSHVFYSTRLSFDQRWIKTTPILVPRWSPRRRVYYATVELRPAPNSLSLLRVCQRVNLEIGHSWMGQVLFSFSSAKTMLEKLTPLEPSILARIRHMRITGRPPRLTLQSDQDTLRCGWAEMLNVLPGLCLDRLTVLGDYALIQSLNFGSIDKLIRDSDGWKELYFICHNSAILRTFNEEHSPHKVYREPQRFNLNSTLVSRDGPTASVSIYRSINAADHGQMISNPATREAFVRPAPIPIQDWAAARKAADSPHEINKEVMVVARRGRGVDYAVKPLSIDVRDVEVVEGRTRSHVLNWGDELDSYTHVDEYEWTVLHSEHHFFAARS